MKSSSLFILVLIAVLGLSGQLSAQEQKPESSSKPLPENVLNAELKSARGPVFRLSDYKGNVLVLSFWATWCLPCKFQTPALVKLQQEFRSEGVKVVELTNEDPAVSAKRVRVWMRNYKVNYRVGWAPEELFEALALENAPIPQVFIVDRNGNILTRFIGFNREKTTHEMRQRIEAALESR